MATAKANIWNLKVGDIITFTNRVGYKVEILVTRVEEKSWYALGRNSWGTLQSYAKYPDFKIITNPQPHPTMTHTTTPQLADVTPAEIAQIDLMIEQLKDTRVFTGGDEKRYFFISILRRMRDAKGTGYFKKLIPGHTKIYLASPVFGHSDYNKTAIMELNADSLRFMEEFNAMM
jgi:hypothetical protein